MNRQYPHTTQSVLPRRVVATRLFPDVKPASAVRHLNRWIAGDPELQALLHLYGYKPGTQFLTSRQVRVIEQYV